MPRDSKSPATNPLAGKPPRGHGMYKLIQAINEGMVQLESARWGLQLWCQGKIRKSKACIECDWEFAPGAEMYRPVTNAGNRADRICTRCIALLTQNPGGEDEEKTKQKD